MKCRVVVKDRLQKKTIKSTRVGNIVADRDADKHCS